MVRYLDYTGKLAAPKLAEIMEIKEYLDNGITVVFEDTKKLK